MRLRHPWLALPMFRSLAGALRLPAAGLAAGGGVALAAPQERPKIFLVGGPSGAGKDTLLLGARDALKKSGAVAFAPRDVTRSPERCTALERSATRDEFAAREADGAYSLAWRAHGDTAYGVPGAAVDAALDRGSSVVLNVSRSAFAAARDTYASKADAVVVLVTASAAALRARLEGRGREDEAAVEERIKRAAAYAPPEAKGFSVARVRNEGSREAGIDRFVAALERPDAFDVAVVGLVGCSAAGKSTLTAALADEPAATVCLDDFYKPLKDCPTFDLAGDIAWPGGNVPEAFLARGNADLNHPDAVDWKAAEDALDGAVDAVVDARLRGGAGGYVLVEGLLLLGEGAAERLRDRCGAVVLLDDRHGDADAQEVLWRRKYTRRGHLGKPSYEDRGVSEAAYAAYWSDYVAKRWKAHGLDRASSVDPKRLVVLDCLRPVEDLAADMVANIRS